MVLNPGQPWSWESLWSSAYENMATSGIPRPKQAQKVTLHSAEATPGLCLVSCWAENTGEPGHGH